MPKTPTFRIQTGSLKGQSFLLPPVADASVRPSKNRVLQAGFNMLESRVHLEDCTFLDACCGSGQWALEALSRGATVTALDVNTSTMQQNAMKLIQEFRPSLEVKKGALETFLPPHAYDVIFCDPPYAQLPLYRKLLDSPQWLTLEGYLLLELGSKETLEIPTLWDVAQQKTYGHSTLCLLQRV